MSRGMSIMHASTMECFQSCIRNPEEIAYFFCCRLISSCAFRIIFLFVFYHKHRTIICGDDKRVANNRSLLNFSVRFITNYNVTQTNIHTFVPGCTCRVRHIQMELHIYSCLRVIRLFARSRYCLSRASLRKACQIEDT